MGSILLEPDQLCGKRYPPGPSHPGPAVGGLFNDPMSPDIRLRLDQNVFYSYEVKQTSLDATRPDLSPGCELGKVRAWGMVTGTQGAPE